MAHTEMNRALPINLHSSLILILKGKKISIYICQVSVDVEFELMVAGECLQYL